MGSGFFELALLMVFVVTITALFIASVVHLAVVHDNDRLTDPATDLDGSAPDVRSTAAPRGAPEPVGDHPTPTNRHDPTRPRRNTVTVRLSHPDGLLQQSDYAPVASAVGSRIVLLAGQLAVNPEGQPTSTDLAGQVHDALGNIATGVRGAGGDVDDVARLTCYVVGWTTEMSTSLFEGLARAQESFGYSSPLPPLTVIGVQALWVPELLVEVEATAVLP